MKKEGTEGDNDEDDEDNGDDTKEKGAARSSVFFSSEKEAIEPRPFPLLSLGDVSVNSSCNNKQTQTSQLLKITLWFFVRTLTSVAKH